MISDGLEMKNEGDVNVLTATFSKRGTGFEL
jgi:hypothetical protein